MKKILFIGISLLFFTGLSFAQTRNIILVKAPTENPTSQKRKAVVIGMSDYGAGKSLSNTLNDADDMATVFTRLGFQVTLLKDNDFRNLRTNLTNWYNTIDGNDMAVFYFAGHGIEVNGTNYLIPIEAELNSPTDVEFNTLNVNWVLGKMDEKRVGMKLLILDACRDNPFTRGWTRGNSNNGLAQMAAPQGTFIAFAAAPGAVAHDGRNFNLRNGVFTHYLKQEIVKAGASIDEIFNNVTGSVSNLTNRQQTPFRNSSLAGNFYFITRGNNDEPIPFPVPTPVPTPQPQADGVVINGVRWATRNVDNPGTFAASPESSGKFYQWNRRTAWPVTGSVYGWESSTSSGTSWIKANDPSPTGWRLPTLDEIKKLLDTGKVTNEWTTQNGVSGRKFIDKATGNSIFLPAVGERNYNSGGVLYTGLYGDYWSNTQNDGGVDNAYYLNFRSDNSKWDYWPSKATGRSVRPVAE